jgi:hypothetical protein
VTSVIAVTQRPMISEFSSQRVNKVSSNRYLMCSSVGGSLNQNGVLVMS